MSVRVMTWVWDNGPDSATEKLVLLALADFCDDAGNCWPSMARIARKACVEDRSARRIIRRLERAGYLDTVAGGGRHGCNQYRIRMKDQEPELPLGKPGHSAPRTQCPHRTLSAQNPDTECTKPGLPGPPNRQEPSGTVNTPLSPPKGGRRRNVVTFGVSEAVRRRLEAGE